MTVPNAELLADESVPRVALDGKQWPIPKLSMKQMKVIVPLLQTFVDQGNLRKSVVSEDGLAALETIVLAGLQRGHKDMTREQFEEMAVGLPELAQAVVVVARQTGAYDGTKAGDGPLDRKSSPTGTP